MILKELSIPIYDYQEPFAYLLGFLVDLIHQSIYEADN